MKVPVLASRRPAARGFTLIEIMIVVAIIIILVGAVIAVGTNVRTSAMIKATNGTLASLTSAKAEFVANTGKEPSGTATNTSTSYFSEFRAVPRVWQMIQKLPQNSSGTAITDAWGNNITYTPSSSTVPEGYFISNGPDGIWGNSDDIRSTEAHQ